jgi:hypothetical protein
MTNQISPGAAFVAVLFLSAATSVCLAGHEMKWSEVPDAVRATVLANGGTDGQQVDRENGRKNGLAVFEAGVKDKNGNVADLVITEDGKLVETKHDDEANAAVQNAPAGKLVFSKMKFSHPRDITNPLLPLAYLKQDILEGTEDGAKVRVERTLMPHERKTFTIDGQKVEALAMEDREFHNGALEEVTLDYFAQDDEGNVYYLGEDVNEYTDGKISGHDGAWLLGKDTLTPGVIIPAHPKAGDKFQSEAVNKEITENDEIVSVSETVSVPAGTFENCVKVKETLSDGSVEFKFYSSGIGVVREVPSVGDEPLISHTTR